MGVSIWQILILLIFLAFPVAIGLIIFLVLRSRKQ